MKPRKVRVKQATLHAKGFVRTTCGAAAIAIAVLCTSGTHAADDHPVKPPVRGLASMGAFRFVGSGGDPVNTLEPLNAKPGIYGWAAMIEANKTR
jgi:hypothetical protein